MGIPWYMWVINALCAILPALTVAVVLFLRIEGIRGDAHTTEHKIALQSKDYQSIITQHQTILDKIADVAGEGHAQRVRAINLEESLVALSNKWNSRERADKLAEKRAAKREEEENGGPVQEVPVTEQQLLPFPQQVYQPQTGILPKKRKFGEMP